MILAESVNADIVPLSKCGMTLGSLSSSVYEANLRYSD